jgi:hypothetical protein
MSSAFMYQGQFFYVSNTRFFGLIDDGLMVGKKTAETDTERLYVSVLEKRSESFFPGCDLAIEGAFPSLDERKFWARIFFDVAYLAFQREIMGGFSFVGDAYMLARMITRSVQEEEGGWHPERTLESLEPDPFKKGFQIKI